MTAGIGHNMPPLSERLEIDHASLAQQVADALALEPLSPIFTDEDAETYTERAKHLKKIAATVEKARKAEKEQILRDGRTVEDFFKTLVKPVDDACQSVVVALNAFQRKKLEEEKARQRAEEEAARAAATPFDDEPARTRAAPVAAARVVSSTTGKVSATTRRVWRHRVVYLDKVPRQYLMVNDAAIKAAVAGGVREIPGVAIYEDVQTAIR